MKKLSFITKILHNAFLKKDPHGALHMPIYENVAFEFESSQDIEDAFQRRKPAHMYSRITNPTVEAFEQKMKAATGALGVLALSSGMAAISNTIFTLCSKGDNIVTSKHLFGNTYSLFTKTLKNWGLETKFVDLTNLEEIRAAIDENTKAVFLETITNPQLEVADIKGISNIIKDKGVVLIADTTLTPPYIFSSKEYGVDIEVISSTKIISGGATSVGGLIIENGIFDWKKNTKFSEDAKKFGPYAFINTLKNQVFRNLGSCMAPTNAFLQSVGLETLSLRMDVSCKNALTVASVLQKNKKIKAVHYPGLKSSKFYSIAKNQFSEKPGALLTFDLSSKEECYKFMDALKVIRRATNLNDNRSLILHPSSTIFWEYSDAEKVEMNVRNTMLRLSLGIEDSDDLTADIEAALREI